jgi:hypothetical protein
MWVVCGHVLIQECTPKRYVFRRNWIRCSRFVEHSRLYCKQHWGGGLTTWSVYGSKTLNLTIHTNNNDKNWELPYISVKISYHFADMIIL